jgi:hypothetical protein
MMFWTLFVLPAALWSLGVFAAPGFGTAEQTALSRALGGGETIEAIAAAELIDANFANEMQDAIEASAETFDRTKLLDPTSVAFDTRDAVKQGWVRYYICGLQGWGTFRPLVRTLMLNGLGKCSYGARLWARSPILDGAPPITGWLLLPLLALLLILLPLLAMLLWKVRSAYHWLYSSSVINTQPPLAVS